MAQACLSDEKGVDAPRSATVDFGSDVGWMEDKSKLRHRRAGDSQTHMKACVTWPKQT